MDNIENEGRIIDINVEEVKAKLLKLGAKNPKEYSFRRYIFDTIPPLSGKWLRLRSDGQHSTLALKHIVNDKVDGTLEWEITVSDFDKTHEILENSGFKSRSYQENRRLLYKLDGADISIDCWPLIPAYLEIESDSLKNVYLIANKLGFIDEQITGINTEKIYKKYGIDISKKSILKF